MTEKPSEIISKRVEISNISFEEAFTRLEIILEQMNTSSVSLDESLKLYEEADALIALCSQQLNEAERKIEILTKKQNGELCLGPDNQPILSKF